jgi:hypothetical protein
MTFYLPSCSLTVFQNGVYYTGVKVFNYLPIELKWLIESSMKFKVAIRRYLVSHCFYTLDEFFNLNWNCNFVNINVYNINAYLRSDTVLWIWNVLNCFILIINYYCIYNCWLTLREECRLRVFENSAEEDIWAQEGWGNRGVEKTT